MTKDSLFGKLQFPQQLRHYSGKTREMYFTKDGFVVNIATNRLSAFNQIFDVEIPYKGAVLNLIASYFLDATKDLVPNWFLSSPNAVTSIGVAGEIIPYEIIVRGYLAGSAWRAYKNGDRMLCGVSLPEGLKENDKLPSPIITPTRKSEKDEPITREEIISEDEISEENYQIIERYALALFHAGQVMANNVGLILVDTKYEFMRNRFGDIVLADEIHTPDSSRYFYLEGYKERQENGEKQIQLSKEFFREWLMSQGYGEEESKQGKPLPTITPEVVTELSNKYIELYEKIIGKKFPREEAVKTEDGDSVFLSSRLAVHKASFSKESPLVGIVMGSDSDLPIMDKAAFFLEEMGIQYELTIISAHRTPVRMEQYAQSATKRGLKVIIAGAGGAAHLPGMISGGTTLPVIGVPIKSSNSIDGWDSILSILQMPEGVPTATVALNGAKNAGILALQILGISDSAIAAKIFEFKKGLANKVQTTVEKVFDAGYPCYFKE